MNSHERHNLHFTLGVVLFIILIGLRDGIPAEILSSPLVTPQITGRLVRRLEDNWGMASEPARWVVACWASALRNTSGSAAVEGYESATKYLVLYAVIEHGPDVDPVSLERDVLVGYDEADGSVVSSEVVGVYESDSFYPDRPMEPGQDSQLKRTPRFIVLKVEVLHEPTLDPIELCLRAEVCYGSTGSRVEEFEVVDVFEVEPTVVGVCCPFCDCDTGVTAPGVQVCSSCEQEFECNAEGGIIIRSECPYCWSHQSFVVHPYSLEAFMDHEDYDGLSTWKERCHQCGWVFAVTSKGEAVDRYGVQTNCPHCHAHFGVERPDQATSEIRCPDCGSAFEIDGDGEHILTIECPNCGQTDKLNEGYRVCGSCKWRIAVRADGATVAGKPMPFRCVRCEAEWYARHESDKECPSCGRPSGLRLPG